MTDFKAKMHQIRLPTSWIWGPLRGREGLGWGRGGKGEGGGSGGEEMVGPQVTVEPWPLRALLRHWLHGSLCSFWLIRTIFLSILSHFARIQSSRSQYSTSSNHLLCGFCLNFLPKACFKSLQAHQTCVVTVWNSLPCHIVCSLCVVSFKKNLESYDLSNFCTVFG